MQWAVPFYDPKSDLVEFVIWNESSNKPATVSIIINEETLYTYKDIHKFSWMIKPIGKIEEIKSITILINNKIKNHIELSPDNWDLFKETNRAYYE